MSKTVWICMLSLASVLAACEVGDEMEGLEAGDEEILPYEATDPMDYYVGCFTDEGDRALPTLLGGDMTPGGCIELAYYLGYRYVGVQFGGECWAGNEVGYDRVGDHECGGTCAPAPGPRSQLWYFLGTCGAAWRNSIYRVPRF